jgi:hypothetical protein
MSNAASKKPCWHSTVFKIVVDLVAGLLVAYATFHAYDKWNWGPEILVGVLAILLAHTAQAMLEFNGNYAEMRLNVHSVLGALRGVAGLLEDAHELDKGMRQISLSFAISSLNGLTKQGFLEAGLEFHEFLHYVTDLSGKTTRRVFGTSAIRRPVELAKHSKDYLKTLLAGPGYRLMRISVLDINQIDGIVMDGVEALEPVGPTVPPSTKINDFPEVEWWVTQGSGVSYASPMQLDVKPGADRILLWSTHESGLYHRYISGLVESNLNPNSIDDYAVFDDKIVLKFREHRDAERGILFLLWGPTRVGAYIKTFDRVDEALTGKPTLKLSNLGFSTSFHDLLKSIPGPPSRDISKYAHLKPHFASTTVPLPDLYRKVVELVNAGQARFNATYLQPFS